MKIWVCSNVKDNENKTKCETCGTELHDPERLKRHMKKAHGNVPAKKLILMLVMGEHGNMELIQVKKAD